MNLTHQHTIALISIQLHPYTSAVPGKLLRDLPPEDVSGPKLPCMEALCSSLRHTLDAVFRARGERKAAQYKLQVTSCSTNAWLKVYTDLGYPIPVASMSNQAMERASTNLQGFDLFTGMKDSAPGFNDGQSHFRRLLDWATPLIINYHSGRPIQEVAQVILETVDALFLQLALCLEDAWSVHDLDSMEGGRCVVVLDEGSFKL